MSVPPPDHESKVREILSGLQGRRTVLYSGLDLPEAIEWYWEETISCMDRSVPWNRRVEESRRCPVHRLYR